MPTYRQSMPELLETRLKRIYFNEYNMLEAQYTKIANVESSTMAFEDTLKVAGLGNLRLKPEGTPISYDDPVQGARKRVVHQTYALGFRVTMEMQDDEQYGIIDRMPADMGDSTRHHKENLFWAILNDGFAGALHLGLDGLALFHTAHPLLKTGETVSNMASPGVALSESGLEAAMTNFRLTKNDSGRFAPLMYKTLVVHPNDAHTAQKLLETQKTPFVDEQATISTVATSRSGIVDMSVPYLTDTNAWFLFGNKHGLTWYNRMKATFDRNKDSQTKDALFDTMYRASTTVQDWRGAYGSNP